MTVLGAEKLPRPSEDHTSLGDVWIPQKALLPSRKPRCDHRTEAHVQRWQEAGVGRQEHQMRRQEALLPLPCRWPVLRQGLRIHDELGRPARSQ